MLLAGLLPAATWRLRLGTGFGSRKAARDYADDLESDRRRGQWRDPDAAKTIVATWAARWLDPLDVEARTEENYRAYLRNHILPHWQHAPLDPITALAVTAWIKSLRQGYAASTVAGIVTVFSIMLDDAVDGRTRSPTMITTQPATQPNPVPYSRQTAGPISRQATQATPRGARGHRPWVKPLIRAEWSVAVQVREHAPPRHRASY